MQFWHVYVCRRIAACPGAVNPNCVSTSSTNTMYAPAWRAEVSSLDAALQDLDAAVLGGFKGSFKLSEKQTPSGYYVAYSVPGKFRDKPDTVELLIKPEGVQNRQWEGDREGAAVFYRSIAGENDGMPMHHSQASPHTNTENMISHILRPALDPAVMHVHTCVLKDLSSQMVPAHTCNAT